MENNLFETFIQECGSVKQAAKVLNLKREHVSAMRRGIIGVSLIYALKIEKYMREKVGKVVHILDLVSPWTKYQLKNLAFPCTEQPIKLVKISMNNVKYGFTKPDWITRDLSDLNQLRPIIIDENQQLIANPSTYFLYQQQNKKTVPAWRFSLLDLLARKYEPAVLVQTFLICERAAIGIATKKCLGNRQGQRSDIKLRRNLDEVKGRTDALIASLLGFGCKDSYRQGERIQSFGSDVLIQSVNKGKLRISTAAQLTHFTHKKQQEILTHNKKEILNFIYQYKKRR
jgi:hypothetical protein